MPAHTSRSDGAGPGRVPDPGVPVSASSRRRAGVIPVVLAAIVTLVLGGASVARANSAPPLDAHTDLEFSLDGATWSDVPAPVLGSWGCSTDGDPEVPDPEGAIGGTPGADPCSMAPGEYIDRTYHVRNSTDTGRTGRYEVGVGDYVVSDHADFTVSSTISHPEATSDAVRLLGPEHPQADETVDPGSAVTAVELAPGQAALVVDRVAVPDEPGQYAPRQSVSPMMWVSFSDTGVVDSDADGLPDHDENLLGTDPHDPFNTLPDGTVGHRYGPEPFLPTPPTGTELDVEVAALPPGLRLEDGQLVGTPTRAGTYDIGFTVTMPAGATYSSIRRVVIHEGSGGSGPVGSIGLPDLFWPVVIIGGSIGGAAGALGTLGGGLGSLGSPGSLDGGLSSGSTGGLDPADASPGSGSAPATPEAPRAPAPGPTPSSAPSPTPTPGSGQIPAAVVTPGAGAPSSEWARANSEVRGSLPVTGVAVGDLLLWSLTALAAGITLVLLFSRRRDS